MVAGEVGSQLGWVFDSAGKVGKEVDPSGEHIKVQEARQFVRQNNAEMASYGGIVWGFCGIHCRHSL